jgi:hypothetical protein
VIDGDTLEIHGTRIRLWGVDAPESSQLCRGADSDLYRCGAKAANDLGTFARNGRSAVPRPPRTSTGERWRHVRSAAQSGWSAMAWRWIGHDIRRAGMAPPSMTRNDRVAESGREAMWLYRACIRVGGSPANCSDDANAHP